jgi:hypothetical protein
MIPDRVVHYVNAVCCLPLSQQADCVLLAAEARLPRWQQWCRQRAIIDLSDEIIERFIRWRGSGGSNEKSRLEEIAERLLESLPDDLRIEDDPAGGYAGWSLRDVLAIGLDQCEDVHDDILMTAILYAAAAHCGIGPEAASVNPSRLTEPELRFISIWWDRCCERYPELSRCVAV